MTDRDDTSVGTTPSELRADVLAKLLLIQSAAIQLPDEAAIISFVCRGLEQVPGVFRARHVDADGVPSHGAPGGTARFPIRFSESEYGNIAVELGDRQAFAPYEPHVGNLAFMVAVILEERRQRRLSDASQRDLELRVAERTRELSREVMDRRAAEAAALTEKRRAEDYLEIAEAIIVELDAQGRVALLNQRGGDVLGLSVADAIGQDWFKLAIPARDRDAVRAVFDQMMSGDVPLVSYYDNDVVTARGELRHIAWHNTFRRTGQQVTGTLSSGLDITERKRAEAALATEKERLAVTLRSIGDGVITTDTQGRVVVMNLVAEQLTGVRLADAVGKPLSDVLVVVNEMTRLPCLNPVERVLSTGGITELENHTVLLSHDGTERAISDSGAPIRDRDGTILGVVLVFRDVTEKRRLLEHLQRSQRLDAIGVLAGGIAHDFNNLLGGVFGFISLAREEAGDNVSVASALDEALGVFDRAKALTRQMLTFAKGEAPIRRVVEVEPLVTQAARFALSGSGASCEFHFPSDLPEVEVDTDQIGQVIDNLVRNAVQAMGNGGTVVLSGEAVDVATQGGTPPGPSRYVCIRVRDTGEGIPRHVLAKVFDPFFTTKPLGNGLGLAVAYSIVNKHGGYLDVESEVGKGSTFRVFLPVASDAPGHMPSIPPQVYKGGGRVLVLDDEPYLRTLLTKLLSSTGYDVTAVGTGAEAIAAVEVSVATGAAFRLALLDLTIPGGLGGKDVVVAIRKLHPGLVAIAMSGYSEDPVMARPQDFGFTDSLGKPFAMRQLVAILAKHLPQSTPAALLS